MPVLAKEVHPEVEGERYPSWDHQKAFHAWARQRWAMGHRGLLGLLDMGLGKTKCAIDLACVLHVKTLLILAPMRVIDVWREQMEIHATFPYLFAALDDRVRGTDRKTELARETLHKAQVQQRAAVIAINYESAWLDPFAGLSLNTPWDLIIADEAHRLRSPRGRQSSYARKVALRSRYRLGLTGTPMPHAPDDVWALCQFADRRVFDEPYSSFLLRYAIRGGYYGKEIKGWHNLDDLKRKLYSVSFRVEAKDALPDLPPEMDQHLYCNLDTEARRVYDSLQRDFITWLNGPEQQVTVENALVLLLRLQQLTGGNIRTDDGNDRRIDRAKEDLLTEWLENLDPEEPVVVFARFRADLDAIAHASERAGRLCSEISGRMNQAPAWKAGKTTVLAAQIQSAGEGQDFTRARYAAYFSMGFSLKDYLQSRKRIHRPGQTRPVVYYHLLARDSIDPIVLHAVEQRWDLVEYAMKELRPQYAR
jgi:SNF2 family DNA or RNA helicase